MSILDNNGYVHILRHKFRQTKGRAAYFDIYEAQKDCQPEPFCISYCGSGHYFLTLRECLIYAYGRGWISEALLDTGLGAEGECYTEQDDQPGQ